MNDADKIEPLLTYKRLPRVHVNKIRPNKVNPRDPIAKREVEDLMESIRESGGVLVPIVVYKDNSHFVLLDGERRWRACKALSKKDPRFALIPANVIDKPVGRFENLKTMFNIHYKRRGWTTAALAEALGKLERLEKRGPMSSSQVSKLTGVTPVNVEEARLFLQLPKEIRQRSLDGDLKEYYGILLARNLRAVDRAFPELLKRYNWNELARAFVKKVDLGYVKKARTFNYLSKMARFTIEHNSEHLFFTVFERMVKEASFTPQKAMEEIRSQLGAKVEETFRARCEQFRMFLDSYIDEKSPIGTPTRKLLEEISETIKSNL